MSEPAIVAEGLGKRYRLGGPQRRHTSFRDLVSDLALSPIRRFRRLSDHGGGQEEFWALRDVSFAVQPGEVVGVIGRNGAGKSTLLKVLSRIVEPTEGRAILRGRVTSLLEVGTGFHPELSGRENIYLNGSILGMRRREIDRRFDEIVAFAEVERFLDTPVKRYSSGMYVRLAFAVAAHMDPEILIVDEVLAVGDAQFQKKCLGKMKEVAAGGDARSVLFVSHNMTAVRTLCSNGIMLKAGRTEFCGTVEAAISHYMADGLTETLEATRGFRASRQSALSMRDVTILVDGQPSASMPIGAQLSVAVTFNSVVPVRDPRMWIVIRALGGEKLIHASNRFQPSTPHESGLRDGKVVCHLGRLPLVAGRYWIALGVGNAVHDTHWVDDAIGFEVVERDIWGLGSVPSPLTSMMWWPAEFVVSPE
jgi:homopolymeric O-antigen transport system ATP-binding protein